MNEDYLEHHGIKGMKWGVRRYQNADGSLTAAGRKRRSEMSTEEKANRTRKLLKLELASQLWQQCPQRLITFINTQKQSGRL